MPFFGDELDEMQVRGRRDAALREKKA